MANCWEPALGFENEYEVSWDGRVRSLKHGGAKILRPRRGRYLGVCLRRDGKTISKNVHALVAEAFLGPRPDGMEVNHLDGNRLNNCLSNIEYCSPSENCKHAFRVGLKSHKGERNPNAIAVRRRVGRHE